MPSSCGRRRRSIGDTTARSAVGREVLKAIPDVMCVGLTAKGHPRHPLYVPAAQPLVGLQSAKGP